MKPIYAADCETDPFLYGRIPEPFIWGLYNGRKYIEFESCGRQSSTERFINYARKLDAIIYAHNGGKFDWHFLSPYFHNRSRILAIAGRLARFKIGHAEFRDSYNLMPIALEQYKKEKFDYWKMEGVARADFMDEIRKYLKSDCVNLWDMIHGFESEFGRHLTQATAAMSIWQTRYMDRERAPQSSANFYDDTAPYYYGGRVQCFESGDLLLDAKSYDIHSAYPAAMLSGHPYDTSFSTIKEPTRKELATVRPIGPHFFDVRCVSRGAFPYRGISKKLYYPADDVSRVYHVTGWELEAARETGTIEAEKIIGVRVNGGRLVSFRPYIEYFWNERKRAKVADDIGRDWYCKIFMNGLYGKFAADPRKYRDYELRLLSALPEILDAKLDFDYFREWLLVERPSDKAYEPRFYNLATAASITGLVRSNLWRAICTAGRPLYCDTDSVTVASGRGNRAPALEVGPELGQWGLEGEYDRCIIAGKKLYAFHYKGKPETDSRDFKRNLEGNWKKASKGVILDAQEMSRIVKGERIKFLPIAPSFSIHKDKPTFLARDVVQTATDITTVPREDDPEFSE